MEYNKTNEKVKSRKREKTLKKSLFYTLIGLSCLTAFLGRDKNKFLGNETNAYKIQYILDHEANYPRELVDLALKKEETVDFIYNYKENKHTQKTINIENEYIEGKVPLLMQWDERWGYNLYGDTYMAINGCGPTALAMVIVGLTGDTTVNPKAVADFSYSNGYYVKNVGTKWDLMIEGAKAFGIQGEQMPLSEKHILSTLQSGQPIIASMAPGEFTASGHFIVLVGVTEDGKIIVNDSDSKKRSSKTWDMDVFMKETKNLWKFYL